jgi:hypothetical protein
MTLNAAIRDIPMPVRLARRPVSERGFPVPWFVSRINGQWDFVNVDPRKIVEAHHRKLCWLCGGPLGRFVAFVIGPMCSINRISSEPPAHRDCAEYAVRACPFLARPAMRRNEKAAHNDGATVPGIMVQHNPGACLLWLTRSYRVEHGLFYLGEPIELYWYAEGRTATRAEIDAAIAKAEPFLRKHAEAEGREAVVELERQIERARKLLPQQDASP